MRVPQLSDRMKEAPAHALRAVFSGIGQVLLVADRIRHRAGQDPVAIPPAVAALSPVAVPSPVAAPSAAVTPAAPAALGGEPPLAGYDGLTVPQLRARMRTLDPAQLHVLIGYERAHAGRDAVISMFERRIGKIESGE
jgi:hypothetical protein